MKCGARFVILLAVATACSSSSQTAAERAAEAARSDSSAAGYDVGPLSTAGPSTRPTPDTAPAPPSSRDSAASIGPGGVTSIGSAPAADTSRRTAATTDTGSRTVAGRGGPRGTGSGGTGQRRDSGTTVLPPLDPALEPDFIAYDTARKTVTFQLAAGDEIQDQVSFNGVQRGRHTLTVPLGWRVVVAFANRDPQLPHSATIVDVVGAVPEQLPEPVFTRAQTVRMEEGLLEGDADEMTFVADRVGRFLIACGVIGHAQRGQWITLNVSTTATRPTYR